MIAGRYSLDREIGRGGMGAVWLGRDEVLGRQVALKQIGLMPGADSTDLARAEREARLSAQLHHPHVVAVFDVVIDPETSGHWLVMEYVEGTTLAQLVRSRGPLSPDDAAPLLWQTADALLAAHAAGIVHRDVKPANILIDTNRRAKLTDFGIARIAADPALTQTGMVTGSPAYLAPEVAMGGRGDEAVDVWSLGATTFFVLAGRPPYEIGDNVLGGLYRIVNEDPPYLEAGWLTPLLAGTLVKDPAQRWSMAQVRSFLADRTDHALDPTRADPTPPPVIAPTPADRTLTTRASGAGPAGGVRKLWRTPTNRLLVGLVAAILLGLGLWAALADGDAPSNQAGSGASSQPSSTPEEEPEPTEEGIKTFIRDYVDAVGSDPATSWQMLTPKFQNESGGFETYKRFWDSASNGRVLSISANPDNLSVSYQVRFDNFDNGPGPTVLDLVFEDGRYLIDGERSQGFTPAN